MPEPMTTTSAVGRPAGLGRGQAAGEPAYGRVHSRQASARAASDGDVAPDQPGAVEGLGRVEAGGQDLVVGVDEDHVRLELPGLGGLHLAVADQDHDVAGVHQPGRGAVDAEHAAAALAGDRVGLQPGAVGDVDDVHELAGQQVGGVEQVLVDGDRADVVQVGLGDGGPVDLALHHGAEHQRVLPIVRGRLSMRRVVPTRAATRIRASVPRR